MRCARMASRDHVSGALLVLLGAAVAWRGHSYGLGSLSSMGSGYFPTALGAILVALGIGVAALADRGASPRWPGRAAWRGGLLVLGAVLVFVVVGEHGGLLPATFGCVFVAALADSRNSLRDAALLAVAMSLVSVLLFHAALHVELPLLRWE